MTGAKQVVVRDSKPLYIATKTLTGVSSLGTKYPYLLVDADNAGGEWPHDASARVDVQFVNMRIDPASGFIGNVRLGGITSVDSVAGSSPTFFEYPFAVNDGAISHNLEYNSETGMKGDFSNLIGPTINSDTNIQLGVSSFEGPDGAFYESGLGDIMMDVSASGATVDLAISIGYTVI